MPGQQKHGHFTGGRMSPEYAAWSGAKSRCSNPKKRDYHRYGGRGIRVCERWNSFENFLEDMGLRPSSEHSLDRRDNNGDYSPSNCRWATKKEQDRNRRDNHVVEFRGRSMALVEAIELAGLPSAVVRGRITLGWTVERALSEAVHESR